MKIVLFYARVLHERVHQEEVRVPPMGLYYIGALFREKGYDVDVINEYDLEEGPETTEALLERLRPDVIGFSVLHANRWSAVDTARVAKRLDPDVHVVFGGVGATFLWDQILTHVPEVDVVVLGEGEIPFLELVRHLEREDPGPLDRIRGLAFRRDGRAVRTPDAPVIEDLDRLPNPARYFTYQHVSATRGCAGNCTFCGSPRFWGRKVRSHSPDYFVEQLDFLHRRGISFFFVSDDTFTASRKRVIDICRGILERRLPISWFAISRVDHVDEEMLDWMRRAGCIQISYGVESGSEAIRRRLNKPLRTDRIRRAFDLTTRAGILPRAYFIYGCPGETEKTIQEALELIDEIRPLGAIFYVLEVFPGTALYEEMKKKGRVSDEAWLERIEGIPYVDLDPALSREDVLAWGKTLRDGFHRRLGGFARGLKLIDDPDRAPLNADFCSRLAMTFSHGDYSGIEAISNPQGVAEDLYRRALTYHPDPRAFLGLSILYQKRGDHLKAVRLLEQGLSSHVGSEPLSLCLGVSLMNLNRFEEALEVFSRFPDSAEARAFAAKCT